MTKDDNAGYIMTVDAACTYYERVIEAEKTLGPLSVEEKTVILKSLGTPLTLQDLMYAIQGKRVLIIKDKNGQES